MTEPKTNLLEMLDRLDEVVTEARDAAVADDYTTVREKLAEVNNNLDTMLMQANVEERAQEQAQEGGEA